MHRENKNVLHNIIIITHAYDWRSIFSRTAVSIPGVYRYYSSLHSAATSVPYTAYLNRVRLRGGLSVNHGIYAACAGPAAAVSAVLSAVTLSQLAFDYCPRARAYTNTNDFHRLSSPAAERVVVDRLLSYNNMALLLSSY